MLTFVHISDSHIGPTRDFTYHARVPLDDLHHLVTTLNDFPQPPDFVLHTGDVAHDQRAESFSLAAEALSRLTVPVYYANGNHDDPALLRQVLGAPAHPSGDLHAPLDYTFTVKGERFVVLDSNSPDVPDPQGKLGQDQLTWLRAEIARAPADAPLSVIVHHAPFRMASPWLDANMIITNGDALHAALLPTRGRLRGVFYGHLHRSSQVIRDGITYTCAPGTSWQYDWQPWHDRPQVDVMSTPGFNVVHCLNTATAILNYGA
jgi:3',5'-cyclic-AMP phosphodiesterase